MILIGDIGNTETNFCILNKKFKIIKRLNFDTLKTECPNKQKNGSK